MMLTNNDKKIEASSFAFVTSNNPICTAAGSTRLQLPSPARSRHHHSVSCFANTASYSNCERHCRNTEHCGAAERQMSKNAFSQSLRWNSTRPCEVWSRSFPKLYRHSANLLFMQKYLSVFGQPRRLLFMAEEKLSPCLGVWKLLIISKALRDSSTAVHLGYR